MSDSPQVTDVPERWTPEFIGEVCRATGSDTHAGHLLVELSAWIAREDTRNVISRRWRRHRGRELTAIAIRHAERLALAAEVLHARSEEVEA